jgi:hypothetical protein
MPATLPRSSASLQFQARPRARTLTRARATVTFGTFRGLPSTALRLPSSSAAFLNRLKKP